MPREILLIEDERPIAELVMLHLGEAGLHVTHEEDGVRGLTRALQDDWDMILLDLSLPRCDGLDICRQVRECNPATPIIVVTARGEEAERVLGLESGADDYVTKPFSVSELVARVNALFRRVDTLRETPPSGTIAAGDIVLEPATHSARVAGAAVALTAREFELLAHFARSPGHVFRRSELLSAVWGQTHEGYLHTVNTHINRLRAKIEPEPGRPRYITTVWGVGYKLVAHVKPSG